MNVRLRSPPQQISRDKQRQILETIGKDLKVTHPKDWYSVKISEIRNSWRKNASELGFPKYTNLMIALGGSLISSLKRVYPEHEWSIHKFFRKEKNTWTNTQHLRLFFDEIAKELKVAHPSQWKRVSREDIIKNGGSSLLQQFKGSLSDALQSAYPEHNWVDIFSSSQSSMREAGYWKSKENQVQFFKTLSTRLFPNVPFEEAMSRLSYAQVVNHGGSGLLNYYDGSLRKALESLFNINTYSTSIRESLPTLSTKKNQEYLHGTLQRLFPEKEIYNNLQLNSMLYLKKT